MTESHFREPASIEEAIAEKRALEHDIMNIERQLAEKTRTDGTGRPVLGLDYKRWRSKAHASMVYKKAEHAYVKDWIKQRRREIDAGRLGIHNPNDPRELIQKARIAMKKALDGDDSDIGMAYNMLDQYLNHAA